MIHPTFYHRSTDKQIEVQSLEFLSSYYKDDNSFMQVESRFYCIMVRVPASKTIDSESSTIVSSSLGLVKPKTKKLVFVAPLLNTQH